MSGVGVTDIIKSLSDLQERFGLCQTNDDRFFNEWIEDLPELKLIHSNIPQYDASRTFSLFLRRHELGQVLQILKQLGQVILE